MFGSLFIISILSLSVLLGVVFLTSKSRTQEENTLYVTLLSAMISLTLLILMLYCFTQTPAVINQGYYSEEDEMFDPYEKLDDIEVRTYDLEDRIEQIEQRKNQK